MPGSRGRIFRGLIVGVLAAALGAVLLEGATSLFMGEPLSARLLGRGLPFQAPPAAPDRGAAAGLTEGPYARDRDPEVGFRMKRNSTARFAGVEAHTDAWGDRVRVGPEPEPGATRIVVLGDSIAFGFGVADDETLGHDLEQLLAATMAPRTSGPVVLTAACPGWNQTNSFRYLRDHLARLDPDVVLYLAVGNDFDDATAIDELGWRTADVDPSPDRPQASIERHQRLLGGMEHQPSRPALLEVVMAGGPDVVEMALRTGQTAESRRRWDSFVASIRTLDQDLSVRGARFAVMLPNDRNLYRRAEALLGLALPSLTVFGLISERYEEDKLPDDAHPNARCLRASARRAAEELLARGWVPGAGAGALEPADERYADRPYVALAPGEGPRLLAEQDALWGRFLRHEVDLDTALGLHQVYGGLLGDGTVGKHVFAALRLEDARALELVLVRRPQDSAVWPLALELEVDGKLLTRLEVPRPSSEEDPLWRVEIPLVGAGPSPYHDVLVRASSWELERRPGGDQLASYRLRRLALLAE